MESPQKFSLAKASKRALPHVSLSTDSVQLASGVLLLVIGVLLMSTTPANFPGALLLALGCVLFCACAAPPEVDPMFARDLMARDLSIM
jgi:peptidoglycan/LPS O-acetylase OafA/YrhL